MPDTTISDVDRAAATEYCNEWIYERYTDVSEAINAMAGVLAAHRTTAAEAARGEERERIVGLIDDLLENAWNTEPKIYCEGLIRAHLLLMRLLDAPPPPAPLTPDAVKRMLPATYTANGLSVFERMGGIGKIEWTECEGKLSLYVNDWGTPLESIGTVSAFAALIKALRVEVGNG